jgi:exopolyphosphatase/guanosine-5'-triphosphate,3'-diphosphate pyrophosphatase
MNLAALDLGSNSFHLLVARVTSTGALEKVTSHKEMLRLGAIVQEYGRLPHAVFQDALAAVGTLASVARAFRAERIVAVATSALRSATNGKDFVVAAAQQHRIAVEMVSGELEGELAYRGARSGFSELPDRVGVLDIGGGSVEVAVGDERSCRWSESLPLGFLRLAQSLGAHGALGAEAIRARVCSESLRVAKRLDNLDKLPLAGAWIFSGGTARAFDKLFGARGLERSSAVVRRMAWDVLKSSPERLRQVGVEPDRISTLAFGVGVLDGLMEGFGVESMRVSPGGLREGVLLREVDRIAESSGLRFPNASLLSA